LRWHASKANVHCHQPRVQSAQQLLRGLPRTLQAPTRLQPTQMFNKKRFSWKPSPRGNDAVHPHHHHQPPSAKCPGCRANVTAIALLAVDRRCGCTWCTLNS
jgi:hypothetical protein